MPSTISLPAKAQSNSRISANCVITEAIPNPASAQSTGSLSRGETLRGLSRGETLRDLPLSADGSFGMSAAIKHSFYFSNSLNAST
jgi:hypothetical protein